ncbi:SCO7613 C-terminal domain-containing membrane protein [Nocardioides jensenii]|uniref:SCO7613 C-terminal domain-containing membrane protein n=1 Tax=Nocardioides jensenii TaxID=1843 RepID=UPI00082E45F8|nr:hypothetical protein [Nocardioides jensenii]
MFRYADPEACPVCRSVVTAGSTGCAQCRTTLTGSVALQLFATLTRADTLVRQLAELSANSTVARTPARPHAVAAGLSAPGLSSPGLAGSFSADLTPYPAAPAAPRRGVGSGMSSASVPRILLGLGATCLLVAALVFLAVAWSALGVGGRTVVLLALTLAAAGGAWLLARADLRAGAESFTTLALGLLTLDVFGARSSGWLGEIDHDTFTFVIGATLALAGLGGAHLLRAGTVGRLISAQLIGGLGVVLGTGGLTSTVINGEGRGLDLIAVSALAWFVLQVGAAWGCHRLRLPIATVVVLVGAGLAWLELLVVGLIRIDVPPTVTGVWGGFQVWPALLAAGIAASVALPVGPTRRLPEPARIAGAAAGVALVTALATLPAADESGTIVTLVALTVVLVAAAATTLLARAWRPVVALPAVLAGLGLLGSATFLAGTALDALMVHEVWTVRAGHALERPDLAWHWPLLLPVATFGVLLAGWVTVNQLTEVSLRRVVAPVGLVVVASLTLLPALYGAPLSVMIALLLVTGLALSALSARSAVELGTTALVLGVLTAGLALVASFQSEGLTAVTTGLSTVAALATTTARRPLVRQLGDLAFAPVAAVFLWTALDLAGVDATWRAIPVLGALGAWAVLGARPERELPVALVAVVTVAVSLVEGSGVAQTWLAVDLTLAAVLAHLSALLNAHRRGLGWLGLGLMVVAQWVRLEQVGVETVEAYTLPLAVVLMAVGVLRMHLGARHDRLPSPRALGPGLSLALVPSLLVALTDPVSLRAALLGVACLLVLGIGITLRWSAPLVAGATVGLLLVLREATYASVLPQWALIGTIGLVLTVVGVTWESRMRDVKRAAGYLSRLR